MTAGCPKSIYSAQGGPNISSDDSILCNNSIDDKFLNRPSYNVAVSGDDLIDDDTVAVVSVICGIVRVPNERSLML